MGEAMLNLGDFDTAGHFYQEAYDAAATKFADLKAARRNARWLIDYWIAEGKLEESDRGLIDKWLPIPSVDCSSLRPSDDVKGIASVLARGNGLVMLLNQQETALLAWDRRSSVAWFPVPLHRLTTHPALPIWAGIEADRHLQVVKLEGQKTG